MPKKKTIRKRANKSGTIVKLKGNRRKPFAVRVTTGRDQETGKLIRKDLEYFETEIEASDFLDMYNLMKKKNNRITISDEQAKMIDNDLFEKVKSVTNQEKQMLTFGDIFWILYEEKYKHFKSHKSNISWFNNFNKIHKRKINDINLFDLQEVIDTHIEDGKREGTLSHMKGIAKDIFEYAVIHEYVGRDYDFCSYIKISSSKSNKTKLRDRRPFSIDEIRILQRQNSIMSKYILLFIFSGCRPNELLEINTSNVFIDVHCADDGIDKIVSYMITGSKTKAGTNRIIPINDCIKPIIIELLKEHPNYMIYPQSNNIIAKFNTKFVDYIKSLSMDHIPYECRHTFSTLAKLNKVETFARKRIMGHKNNDLTDDTYTHSIINYLFDEMNKIKV